MRRLSSLTHSSGTVLVASLLLMGVLLLVGTALLTVALTEGQIALNERNAVEALYTAEAGGERVRGSLFAGLLAEAVSPSDIFQGSVSHSTEPRRRLPPDPLKIFTFLPDALSVLSRLGRPIPFDSGHFIVAVAQEAEAAEKSKGRNYTLLITSSGEFRGARRTIQTLVSFDPLLLTRSPAALFLLDEVEIYAEGNTFRISGQDPASGGFPESPPRSGIAVLTRTALTEILGHLTPDQAPSVIGEDGGTPSVQVVTSPLTGDLLEFLRHLLTSRADWIFRGGENKLTAEMGNKSQLMLVIGEAVEGREAGGNLHLGGSFHAVGILIVTGTLTMEERARFEGIVVVVGDSPRLVMKDGSSIEGSVLIAHRTSQEKTGELYLSITGHSQIQYKGEAIMRSTFLLRPQILPWREVTQRE